MASRKDSKGRVLRTGESQRKDGTYQYRYLDIMGKRRYEYAKNLQDLRIKEAEILKSQMDGLNTFDQKITLKDLCQRYLKVVKSSVRKSTFETYGYKVKLICNYPISRLPIADIKLALVKEWLYSLEEEGYRQGTIRSIKHFLYSIFDTAVTSELMLKNPCAFRLRFGEKEPSQKFALDLSQQKQLLDFTRSSERFSQYLDMIIVLMGTGIRVSEMLGLTVKDVDFTSNTIHIGHQLVKYTGDDPHVVRPKSEKGNRFIPMTAEVRQSIRRIITNRSTDREVIIDGTYGFLFVNPYNGVPYTRAAIQYILKQLINEHNSLCSSKLPTLSPHIFRHTFASNMIHSGMDAKTLQCILGHANVSTTLEIYAHMFDSQTAKLMKIAEDYIASSR